MILHVSHDLFAYEAGNLCRVFFPYEELKTVKERPEGAVFSATLTQEGNCFFACVKEGAHTVEETRTQVTITKEQAEYQGTRLLFSVFCRFTGYVPKWGMLTGIHPVKFFTQHVADLGEEAALTLFREQYFVSDEKLALSQRVLRAQQFALIDLGENDFSLYVSIPFCPSRCAYCSFVSQSVEKSQKLIPPYFALLLQELADTARRVEEANLTLRSVYIGGGTPTTLSAGQLRELVQSIRRLFSVTPGTEFTVEAGRPDTIDVEKLCVFKEEGVTRMSINPQTLEDRVLQNIGRKHTAQAVVHTYEQAREYFGGEINMDLIAGLQGDTPESFCATLEKVLQLAPENITVHTLSLKRSAKIFRAGDKEAYHSDKEAVGEMIAYSVKRLTEAGYEPYYLYRQSRMAGNFENTGWAKPGTACRYNIYTMDESQTVIACGAGGVTKVKDPYSGRLERIFNFKYSYEYIDRFQEVLSRKKEVTVLYEQFRQRLH